MDKLDLLKHADELLKFVVDGLQESKDFAVEQAPLVVREVITWGIVSSALGVAFGLLACTVAVICWRRMSHPQTDDPEGWVFGLILSGVVGLMLTALNLSMMLKAMYAPRLYLLDQLKALLK